MKLAKHLLVGLIALAALVLNPWFGVTATRFEFGADEMRTAVEGTWQLTVSPPGEAPHTVTFTITQGSKEVDRHAARELIRSAHACGDRSLVREAAACMEATRMPLQVSRTEKPTQGELTVYGTTFKSAQLDLTNVGEHTPWLYAQLAPDGSVLAVNSYGLRATLVRQR
jgi:hypothetical protein